MEIYKNPKNSFSLRETYMAVGNKAMQDDKLPLRWHSVDVVLQQLLRKLR